MNVNCDIFHELMMMINVDWKRQIFDPEPPK